ncbi:hypothetical protein PG985_011050 [Apiospora marii]|uniref:Uncharacterized protein n=1 Tax=Apiospora marii TaxID=335849 RepID=A0ABR1SSJ8_9PEZI
MQQQLQFQKTQLRMMDRKGRGMLKFSNTWMQSCGAFCATGMFVFIVCLLQSIFDAQVRSDQMIPLDTIHKINSSLTLAFARTAQAVLSFLTTFALQNTFQYIQWAVLGRPQGLSYTSMLGLSPTTGALGMMCLVWSSSTNASSKAWAIIRYSYVHNEDGTSYNTIYETALTYNVTAGVGPFNGSLVHPFLDFLESLAPDYPYTTLPYNYYAMAGSLITYPMLGLVAEPIYCEGQGCFSYLLSSGLEMAVPGVPRGFSDYPLVRIVDVLAIQIEFNEVTTHEVFESKDCNVYGAPGTSIGIELCLAQGPKFGGLQAGVFSCTNGTLGSQCLGNRPLPNITYGIHMFSRRGSIIASQSNHSITGMEDLSEPHLLPAIDIQAYLMSLNWLLNFTAANIPAASSIAENFAIGNDQVPDPSSDGVLSRSFQSILAFPLWFFNDNNWGNTALMASNATTTLPPQYRSVAAIVKPYSKIKFKKTMFYLFILLQGVSLLFIWGVLIWVWVWAPPIPYITSFPLFDAGFKLETPELAQDQSVVLKARDSHVLGLLGQERVFTKGS